MLLVTDGDPDIIPWGQQGIRVDLSNSGTAAKKIREHLNESSVCAVIAPDEKYVEFAAHVSELIGLPHNSIDSLQIAGNKFRARTALRNTKLSTPNFSLIDFDRPIKQQISEIYFPCVAKPLNLSASRGVIRANNPTELIEALQRIHAILSREFEFTTGLKALIEDYVPGSEHALEGYLQNGKLETICIFDKPDPLEGPYFEETYYVTPSKLSDHIQHKLNKCILSVCFYYGLTKCPVHAEVRVQEDQVWIIEVAARSIGGDCARLFELATNSPLEDYVLCRISGKEVKAIHFEEAAGVLMIPVTSSGILRRVEGVTAAQSVENILEVRIDVREGHRLTPWPEGDKYSGFIYSRARSPELVEASLRKSLSCLKFVCMPDFPVTISG